jgi:hypothetical protein
MLVWFVSVLSRIVTPIAVEFSAGVLQAAFLFLTNSVISTSHSAFTPVVSPTTLAIILDAKDEEVARFNCLEAWSRDWSLSKLDGINGEVAFEEIVIQYVKLERAILGNHTILQIVFFLSFSHKKL